MDQNCSVCGRALKNTRWSQRLAWNDKTQIFQRLPTHLGCDPAFLYVKKCENCTCYRKDAEQARELAKEGA